MARLKGAKAVFVSRDPLTNEQRKGGHGDVTGNRSGMEPLQRGYSMKLHRFKRTISTAIFVLLLGVIHGCSIKQTVKPVELSGQPMEICIIKNEKVRPSFLDAYTDALKAYGAGKTWTPELILEMVHDTFPPESRFFRFHPEGPVFTDPYELPERPEREEVGSFLDGTGYWMDFDIPLNHEWSGLTAIFEFRKRPGGLAVILEDLHVL